MQKHDCRIHELQVCIPSQGIWITVKKRTGLGDIPGSPNIVHPTNSVKCTNQPDSSINQSQKDKSIFANKNSSGYAAVGRTSCEQASNQRGSVEDEVKLVWEAKASNMTDPTPRLQSLSREKSVSGATALLDIMRSTIRPKNMKKFTCKFCSKSFVNTNNLNKHSAIYH